MLSTIRQCVQRSARRHFFASASARDLPIEKRVNEIKLLVCDMAGTTVHEGGLVYSTLQKVMNDAGLDVSSEDMVHWHGAQKTEVVAHFVMDRLQLSTGVPKINKTAPKAGDGSASGDGMREFFDKTEKDVVEKPAAIRTNKLASFLCQKIDEQFEVEIQEAYFQEDSPVRLIHPELLEAFGRLRASGCKVALNTGYPKNIQMGLIEKLGLTEHIDAAVCAGDVGLGRPYPYMVQLAMQKCEVMDARTVAKAGDTSRDIEEGLHAGCSIAMGVLTGAGSEETFIKAGADLILPNIVEFVNMREKNMAEKNEEYMLET